LSSTFVGIAGGGRPTAVMNAVLLKDAKITVKPRGDIEKPPKVKKPTVKLKIAAGID
jgi:hypothetical protein